MCVSVAQQAAESSRATEAVTSSEFDNFLATRAKEAEKLPDVGSSGVTQQAQKASRGGRVLQSNDNEEQALFSL